MDPLYELQKQKLVWAHHFDSNRPTTDFEPAEAGALAASLVTAKRLASSDGFKFAASAVLEAGAAETWQGSFWGIQDEGYQ
ncbi:hypothetical protein [Novosphingobium beihaiensis]|uniref:Uncharacterized protein n=1 Tax=Novosphingobium beihaiensis TaxID=2930389 RepID=A0ABT0BVF0_9SPHN|nr:hypothetical protein [Novosphingobium beihaiensis]MCJ2189051.1 hypothetical protein [Novosphingobium beihaiensis]